MNLKETEQELRNLFTQEEIDAINALSNQEFYEKLYGIFMEALSRKKEKEGGKHGKGEQ